MKTIYIIGNTYSLSGKKLARSARLFLTWGRELVECGIENGLLRP